MVYKSWQYPYLKCESCGYIPSENDVINGYNLGTCKICGKENVCYDCRSKKRCCLK